MLIEQYKKILAEEKIKKLEEKLSNIFKEPTPTFFNESTFFSEPISIYSILYIY